MKIYNSANTKSIKLARNNRGLPIIIFQDIIDRTESHEDNNTNENELETSQTIDEKAVYFTLRTSQKFLYGIPKIINNEIENFVISYKSSKTSKNEFLFGIFKRDGKVFLEIIKNGEVVNSFEFAETPFEYNYNGSKKNNSVDTTQFFDLNLFHDWIRSMTNNILVYETIKPSFPRKAPNQNYDKSLNKKNFEKSKTVEN